MKTPVVLLMFNRPDTTAQVLQVLRQVEPRTLLVIADGPRPDRADDVEKCAAARALLDTPGWDCRVIKNYAETNQGLKQRVESGLNWAFEQVDEAIILEDDCVPHPTFFPFCKELLARYRHEPRVMGICGGNFLFGQDVSPYSYHFSRYTLIWGWATWRRAWAHYDGGVREWETVRAENWLRTTLETPLMFRYWEHAFQENFARSHTWDYAWTYSVWRQGGLQVVPNVNMVSNIGFRADASHTLDKDDVFANIPAAAMEFPLRHPPEIARDADADQLTEKNAYSGRNFLNQLFRAMRQRIHSQ